MKGMSFASQGNYGMIVGTTKSPLHSCFLVDVPSCCAECQLAGGMALIAVSAALLWCRYHALGPTTEAAATASVNY